MTQSIASAESVRTEYTNRLNNQQSSLNALERVHRRMGNIKVCLVLIEIAVLWLIYGARAIRQEWAILPVAALVVAAVQHEKYIRQLNRAQRAVQLYKHAVARVDGVWQGRGTSGARFRSANHPYSEDLDLFGPGSLFELLCSARTHEGEARLAGWLCAPSAVSTLQARQLAVDELRPMLDLREDIALLGAKANETADLTRLAAWGAEPIAVSPGYISAAAYFLSGLTLISGIAYLLGTSAIWFEISIVVGQLFALTRRNANAKAGADVDSSARDLEILAELLKRLECEAFMASQLANLSDKLHMEGDPPSNRIAGLAKIVAWRDALRNNMFALIGIPLLWTTHTSLALERWRAKNGPMIAEWIEIAGEFEALGSLARFAYERPNYPFPELVDTGPLCQATGITHPMLPIQSAVPNDIALGCNLNLFIVSGSNMSGKSTLLRTIGVNTVLALAGAPVSARTMRVSTLHIGASLRATDSLLAGVSRFYAEITRLRQIVDIARQNPPALFLLDEILHGTNSHDRTIGAEAVLRALLAADAIGLVTTHDLALAKIAEDSSLLAENIHLEDEMIDGKMVFDYHIKPGVVQKSNAIPLMRAVGLDV